MIHLEATTILTPTVVEEALASLLDQGEVPLADRVKELVAPEEPEVPEIAVLAVDLGEYDELLMEDASALEDVPS